eukprot:1718712-Amphidinium_carterae.1
MKDLVRFGWTEGCPGCVAIRDDKPTRPHNQTCRNRIVQGLGADPRVAETTQRQVQNRLALTPAGDWRKRYLEAIKSRMPDTNPTKYIKHGRWEDEALIKDHMEVCGTSSGVLGTTDGALEHGSRGLPSSFVPPGLPSFSSGGDGGGEIRDEEMPENMKRLRSEGANEDEDETAMKSNRIADEPPTSLLLSSSYQLFGLYNPLEDGKPEEVGEKVEVVDAQAIFQLDPQGKEYQEWMQSFKKEFDAYLDNQVYEEFTEQQARELGVVPREILPMKL